MPCPTTVSILKSSPTCIIGHNRKDIQETAMPVPIELIVYHSRQEQYRGTASSRTKNTMSVRFVRFKRLTSIEITFDRFRKVKYSYPGHRA